MKLSRHTPSAKKLGHRVEKFICSSKLVFNSPGDPIGNNKIVLKKIELLGEKGNKKSNSDFERNFFQPSVRTANHFCRGTTWGFETKGLKLLSEWAKAATKIHILREKVSSRIIIYDGKTFVFLTEKVKWKNAPMFAWESIRPIWKDFFER